MGDLHGEWHKICDVAPKISHVGGTILIQVGDFGLGFLNKAKEAEALAQVNEVLEKHAIELWILRGNHDDPDCFTGKYLFSNIRTIKDYTIEHIGHCNFLFVGGALSIDRADRIPGWSYWSGEGINLIDEVEWNNLLDGRKIHTVISHTGPTVGPPVLREKSQLVQLCALKDPNLIADVKEENAKMDEIWHRIQKQNTCRDWYYGHFHSHGTVDIDGTKFNLLDIGEVQAINIK